MARTKYHVVPDGNVWKGKKVGSSRASVVENTKAAARSATIAIAKNNKPSLVRIHRRDGTIEEERTYGDDPYPPSG